MESSDGGRITRRAALAGSLGALARPVLHAEPWPELDAETSKLRQKFGGVAVIVRHQGGILYQSAAGSVSAATSLPLSTASQLLIAAAVLCAVEWKKLSLDDTVGPYFQGIERPVSLVTVRQLLSHTSGLGIAPGCRSDRAFDDAECAMQLLREPLRFAPGQGVSPSIGGLQVAALIAQKATRMPFEQLLQQRLWGPLRLNATKIERRLPAQTWWPSVIQSSAADMSVFLEMMAGGGVFDGQPVLQPASVRAMMTSQWNGAGRLDNPFAALKRIGSPLAAATPGLGLWRETLEDGTLVVASALGASGFSLWMDPLRQVTGVIAVQAMLRDVLPHYLAIRLAVAQRVAVVKSKK